MTGLTSDCDNIRNVFLTSYILLYIYSTTYSVVSQYDNAKNLMKNYQKNINDDNVIYLNILYKTKAIGKILNNLLYKNYALCSSSVL